MEESIITKDDPLKTAMASASRQEAWITFGDELTSLFAGRNVPLALDPQTIVFAWALQVPMHVPQLQLITAALTDPGFRKEGETILEACRNSLLTWMLHDRP